MGQQILLRRSLLLTHPLRLLSRINQPLSQLHELNLLNTCLCHHDVCGGESNFCDCRCGIEVTCGEGGDKITKASLGLEVDSKGLVRLSAVYIELYLRPFLIVSRRKRRSCSINQKQLPKQEEVI